MDQLDVASLAQLAQKAGLVTEAQLQEVFEELGGRKGDPEAFLLALERRTILTPWQSSKLLKGDVDGYFLGGYRLLYKIKSGSFGRVFRADDRSSGRVVAIKVLRRRWMDDPHRIELFEREARVGLNLRHPNIVEVLGVGRDPASGQYYIVMEFVEGGNLREILQIRKKLEPAEALRLIEDAANGLAHAFARGITHRDIKLTNILISSSGSAKLLDFGLAKFYSAVGAKDEDKVERTVDYAGLERATGVKPGDVRSDIYFLGCVLYESLSGRSPLVTTRDKHQRMQKQRFDNTPLLRKEEVSAPPSVFHLVETMMSLSPHQRFQTPSQLLDAIRAARRDVEGKGTDGRPGPSARAVFVVERNERLQDVIRDKLKESGYRVFLAADPLRAVDRFKQQPYDALVVDAGTVGEDGLMVLERVQRDAEARGVACAGILMLNKDQADWAERVSPRQRVAVMVQPVTIKQLHRKLQELAPTGT